MSISTSSFCGHSAQIMMGINITIELSAVYTKKSFIVKIHELQDKKIRDNQDEEQTTEYKHHPNLQ